MKKTLYILIISLAPAVAFGESSSTISIPSDFTDKIWAQASNLFNSLSGYIVLIVGTILATTVIEIIIHSLKSPGR